MWNMERKICSARLVPYLFGLPLLLFVFYTYLKYRDGSLLLPVFLYVPAVLGFELLSFVKRKNGYGAYPHAENHSFQYLTFKETLDAVQKELRHKMQELESLKTVSEIIVSSRDINTMIECIYTMFNKFTGCDRYFICFSDKATNEIVCRYEFGNVTFGEVGNYLYEESSVKACFESKGTILKNNVYMTNRASNGDKMAIPLNLSEEIIGVIFIESGKPDTFDHANIDFLENLANHAAIAIKNAELFDSIYHQKQEIEALYEETTAVNEQLGGYIEALNKTKEEINEKNDELRKYYGEMQTGYLQTVMALANSIEANDPYTRGHCQRVMEISCEIAKYMDYTEEEINDLRYAAILHDIGKIGIPRDILNKPGRLTEDEFIEIKKHPLIAYGILKDVAFIKTGCEAILQHHERFDGTGYPNGIKGEEMCEFAKILSIADAFDAMTSNRPYREGMSVEAALIELKKCKSSQFDPVMVELVTRIMDNESYN